MLTLPGEYTTIMSCVAHLVSKRIWQHAQLLLIGAILVQDSAWWLPFCA
jgi:hypothetical protein